MEISHGQKSAWYINRKIQGGSRLNLGTVHIPAMIHRGHCGNRTFFRSGSDHSDHGSDRDLHRTVKLSHSVLDGEPTELFFFQDPIVPAAAGKRAADADRTGCDIENLNFQSITRESFLYAERAGRRIGFGGIDLCDIGSFGKKLVVKTVIRFKTDRTSGGNGLHRFVASGKSEMNVFFGNCNHGRYPLI